MAILSMVFEKIAAAEPLDDEERILWLNFLNSVIATKDKVTPMAQGQSIVTALSQITNNAGRLTNGEYISPANQNVPYPELADFTGVVQDSDGIRGINAGILQFQLDSADGKAYAGAGALEIDENGISFPDGGSDGILWGSLIPELNKFGASISAFSSGIKITSWRHLGGQLLPYPDFSSGFTGWTPNFPSWFEIVTLPGYSGNFAHCISAPSDATLTQGRYPVVEGESYLVWGKVISPNDYSYITVKTYAAATGGYAIDWDTYSMKPSPDLVTFHGITKVSAGANYIEFQAGLKLGTYALQFSLSKVGASSLQQWLGATYMDGNFATTNRAYISSDGALYARDEILTGDSVAFSPDGVPPTTPRSGDVAIYGKDDLELYKLTSTTEARILTTLNTIGVTIDGSADEVQLKVQGHSTQTSNIVEIENSAGTDILTIDGTGNVDFKKHMAIAMACDRGATMPTGPANGQWFLHTPTGRTVLYIYSSARGEWYPMLSLQNSTVYIDTTLGTDQMDKGGSTGAGAFKTINYAVQKIGSVLGGYVNFVVAAGTYNETVNFPSYIYLDPQNHNVSVNGATSVNTVLPALTAVSAGTTSAQAYIESAGAGWTVNAFAGMMMLGTSGANNGSYFVVDSNTADRITISGRFAATPLVTDTYSIINLDTLWHRTGASLRCAIAPGSRNVNFRSIDFSSESICVQGHTFSDTRFWQCRLTSSVNFSGPLRFDFSSAQLRNCYITSSNTSTNNVSPILAYSSIVEIGNCLIVSANRTIVAGSAGINGLNNSTIRFGGVSTNSFASKVEGFTNGIWLRSGSVADFDTSGAPVRNWVVGNTTGIRTEMFGSLANSVQITYSGNTNDLLEVITHNAGSIIFNENGDAASDFRVESDTEANMLFLDANGNTDGTLYFGGNSITAAASARKGGLFFPVQAATASAPTYVKGALYFDTTLNKLRVGGATGWETVTSA